MEAMKGPRGFATLPLLLVILAGAVVLSAVGYWAVRSGTYTTFLSQDLTPPLGRNRTPALPQPLSPAPVADSINQFAFDFLPHIDNPDVNVFFSPYSIAMAFAMVDEGASGTTAREIESTFHFPADAGARRSAFQESYTALNQPSNAYTLHTANALWAQKDYLFRGDYLTTVATFYGGKATNLDIAGDPEGAKNTINAWVAGQTQGKITDLIGSLDRTTRLVITNAIYFKGKWLTPFNPGATHPAVFHVNAGKTVEAQMMSGGEDIQARYLENSDLQALWLPYEGKDLSMLILLPKQSDLPALERSLTLQTLANIRTNLASERLQEIDIPKFTMRTDYSLKNPLQQLGMTSAFDSSVADFSGMTGNKDLFVGDAVHKAYVTVDEEGTEAAAATGVVVSAGAVAVPNPKIFNADHPFLFMIQQNATGNILFLGKVVDPTLQ